MPSQPNLIATMFTTTTYGTWLPGDARGYVDSGRILPGDPELQEHARQQMRGDKVLLAPIEQAAAFEALLSATREFKYELLAASIESWHCHFLLIQGYDKPATVAGRLKTRMRQGIQETSPHRRQCWTQGYDKRFCFTHQDVDHRIAYIQRHAGCRDISH